MLSVGYGWHEARLGMHVSKLKTVLHSLRGQSKTIHNNSGHIDKKHKTCALGKTTGHITRVFDNEYVIKCLTAVGTLTAIIVGAVVVLITYRFL